MEAQKQRALVTGASSGLGVEIARVLAKRGIDLAISARRQDRLETLAADLRTSYGIDVIVLPADLSTPLGPQHLFDAVQATGTQIDIVVNNAGFGHFGPFLDQSLEQIEEMLLVDVRALTILTRLFAATMKQQGGGRFLQVSSFAGLQPIPRYSVYSAAKSYVVILTQALRHELMPVGIHVSVVVPGFMPTEFHEVAHHEKTRMMRLLSMPASYVARKAVAGMFRGKMVITPGLFYQLNQLTLGLLPRSAASALSSWVVKDKVTRTEARSLKN
jgi:short-subunit dehydrogenase